MHPSSREDSTLETQHPLLPPPHADTSIVHQSGGPQMPINSLSTPVTDQSTTVFFKSEPMRVGRRQKCRDMSDLSLCLCGDSTRPDDAGSIRCQRAGCETVWVSHTSQYFQNTDRWWYTQYHLQCIGYEDARPRSWTCEACALTKKSRWR